MTIDVTAGVPTTIEGQIEQAWLERSLRRLEQNPTFCRIVDELSNPMEHLRCKALARGYPRNAFATA